MCCNLLVQLAALKIGLILVLKATIKSEFTKKIPMKTAKANFSESTVYEVYEGGVGRSLVLYSDLYIEERVALSQKESLEELSLSNKLLLSEILSALQWARTSPRPKKVVKKATQQMILVPRTNSPRRARTTLEDAVSMLAFPSCLIFT